MSRKFQIKTVPSTWLENNGRRLDCGPYLCGAIEARGLLRRHQTKSLSGLAIEIFHAGRESRTWVDSPGYGVPFMGSTDVLASDVSGLPLISKKQVASTPRFTIRKGWTLITRSGTIGRMAFARSDMDGVACSEHVMRVLPNEELIMPGYLFAYLSSSFGVPIVVSGTYGAIIQHIEPHHIADLPVPRLGAVEDQAHELIQKAADLRTKANQLLEDATRDLEREIGGGPVRWQHNHIQAFAIKTTTFGSKVSRLDAFHHIGYVGEAIDKAVVPLVEVQNVARALRPPIMKRIRVEEGGYEFLGGSELVTLDQRSETRISARTPNIDQFVVYPGYVLFQCVGQRYGLFGRAVLANRQLYGKAVTEAVMRLIPHDIRDAGYISVYLATGFGQRLGMRYSAGTSIPVLQEILCLRSRFLINWPDQERRHAIRQDS